MNCVEWNILRAPTKFETSNAWWNGSLAKAINLSEINYPLPYNLILIFLVLRLIVFVWKLLNICCNLKAEQLFFRKIAVSSSS